jgi:tetratricopeptide (TPR) repeat protein
MKLLELIDDAHTSISAGNYQATVSLCTRVIMHQKGRAIAIEENPWRRPGWGNTAITTDDIENEGAEATAYLLRAFAHASMGNYEKAVNDASRAIAYDPKRENALYIRGFAHLNLGSLEQCIEDSTKVLSLNPDQHDALTIRATAYMQKGRFSKAIEDARKSWQLKPEYKAKAVKSYSLLREGDVTNAKLDAQEVIGFTKDNMDTTVLISAFTVGKIEELKSKGGSQPASRESARRCYQLVLDVMKRISGVKTVKNPFSYYLAIAAERGMRNIRLEPDTHFEADVLFHEIVKPYKIKSYLAELDNDMSELAPRL